MAVIEVMSFRLATGVEDSEFLDADQRAQTEFFYRQPGLVRRTTAHDVDGEWLVLTVWDSPDHADAWVPTSGDDPAFIRWGALLEHSSTVTRRYETID
jgi:heme-degrading monooxygenase HmoA